MRPSTAAENLIHILLASHALLLKRLSDFEEFWLELPFNRIFQHAVGGSPTLWARERVESNERCLM